MDKKGTILLEALEAAVITGSRFAAADLEGPGFPSICDKVWRVFLDLSSTRTGTGFGVNPISYAEIDAYNRLTGCGLDENEVYLLKVADEAFLQQIAENHEREKNLDG